jgi:hypothetical protein
VKISKSEMVGGPGKVNISKSEMVGGPGEVESSKSEMVGGPGKVKISKSEMEGGPGEVESSKSEMVGSGREGIKRIKRWVIVDGVMLLKGAPVDPAKREGKKGRENVILQTNMSERE